MQLSTISASWCDLRVRLPVVVESKMSIHSLQIYSLAQLLSSSKLSNVDICITPQLDGSNTFRVCPCGSGGRVPA